MAADQTGPDRGETGMTGVQTLLPLLSSALLIACLALALTHRWLENPIHRVCLAMAVFAVSLVPIADQAVAHYLAGVIGTLSITSITLLFTYIVYRCTGERFPGKFKNDLRRLYLIVGLTAIFLYPSALGLSHWDLYAHGYYPIILAPSLLAIVVLGIYLNWLFLPLLLAIVFVGYGLELFESNNLWDYLIDPLVAIFCLTQLPKVMTILLRRVTGPAMEAAAVSFAASFLLFAVFLSIVNHDAFRYQLVTEDGFTETVTALSLFLVMLVCAYRLVKLRHHRSLTFLGMTGFIALAGLFGAGEEISWGQRIFDWETPAYFLEHNKQEETGLHNLVIEINDKKISINKVIFGTGLALAMLVYLFIMTPLYRRHRSFGGPFARFIHQLAIPMPRNYQVIGYLVVVACAELLIDSSKRGEMTEFAGSIIFLLNVAYPDNPELFDLDFDQPVS